MYFFHEKSFMFRNVAAALTMIFILSVFLSVDRRGHLPVVRPSLVVLWPCVCFPTLNRSFTSFLIHSLHASAYVTPLSALTYCISITCFLTSSSIYCCVISSTVTRFYCTITPTFSIRMFHSTSLLSLTYTRNMDIP